MENQCNTKYPIVLIHGMGFRDTRHVNYWGRIPKALSDCGASVYYGYQDSHGSIEANALQLKRSIEHILQETKSNKVNLIAHSKGGLDARYMISMLGMHDKVASLTTLSTPHHGSKTMDKILTFPKFIIRAVAFCADLWSRVLGDEKPDSITVLHQFSTMHALRFNETVPDSPDVYYQSFAFVMKNMFSDFLIFFPYSVIRLLEGENDGLLTPSAVAWTNFRGVVRSASNRGISHYDEIDMRRRRFSKKTNPDQASDIILFYIALVADLKELGF